MENGESESLASVREILPANGVHLSPRALTLTGGEHSMAAKASSMPLYDERRGSDF
jgi:hypothetical protein